MASFLVVVLADVIFCQISTHQFYRKSIHPEYYETILRAVPERNMKSMT